MKERPGKPEDQQGRPTQNLNGTHTKHDNQQHTQNRSQLWDVQFMLQRYLSYQIAISQCAILVREMHLHQFVFRTAKNYM